MKKLIIMAMATLLGISLMGQKREIVELINQKGTIESDMIWIKSDGWVSSFTDKMKLFNKTDLQFVVDQTEKEAARLDEIIRTRSDIIKNETDPEKQARKLERYFTDKDKAEECFRQAEALKARALKVHDAAASYLSMVHNILPEGELTCFKYFSKDVYSNSFRVTLSKNDEGKAVITYNFEDEAVVDNSVFDKVYNMIKEGQLYDIAKSYEPFDLPLDVNEWSWTLTMNFGDNEIYSSGIGAEPDHKETLGAILDVLRKAFDEAKGN